MRPVTPAAPAPLRVARLASTDARYRLERRDSLLLEYPNGSQAQVLQRTAWIRLLLAAGAGEPLTLVLDSLRTTGSLPLDSLRPLDGMVWKGRLSQGRVVDLQPSRQAPLADQLVTPLLVDLLPMMPAAGIAAGDSWRDSTARPERLAGAELPTSVTTSYRASDGAGRVTLDVHADAQVTARGTSTQFGQPIEIVAQGTRHHAWRLSPAGQLEGSTHADTLRLSLDVPSVGQTVPATQVGHTTATRIGR
ncbi:MAG: hypothetical protein MUC69_00130 [Gemmatimonadales bacterium]|nr:hypothetical protein [Gemmatimonadales bacterium]